jgi:glycosyltransferase involved in cell wall biosynthesis
MCTTGADLKAEEAKHQNGEGGVLRVLHLHSGNMYGGVETMLVTLARLRQLCPSMEPHFGLCYEGRLSRELQSAGVPVYFFGGVRISRPWTGWRARRHLRMLLECEHFDAAICHMPWPLVIFGSTLRRAGPPVVFWAHGLHDGRNRLERMAQRHTPDVTVANSSFVAHSTASLFPGVPTRVLYIPVVLGNGSKSADWRGTVRRELGVDEQTAVIIQVSRAEAWKGHLLHIRALAELKHLKGWTCWMAGGSQNSNEARYFHQVQQMAADLGIADRVRFLGQRSDIEQLLAGADIFCQPNEGPEPFGIVFVEALWAGRPVVTTAMGGALEIVDDSCGLRVEPGSPAKLAAALEQLIVSSALRSRLGAAGPARAKCLCDPASQIPALQQLLRSTVLAVVGGPRG